MNEPAVRTPNLSAPEPVITSCREIIESAGALALLVTEQPGVGRALTRLGLGPVVAALADSVMTLDFHTNYLGGPPAPEPTGMPDGPLSGFY